MSDVNTDDLAQAIKADANLTDEQKNHILSRLEDPTFFNRLIYGGLGAGVAALISKFLGLSTKAKIIVALGGFGIGQLILKKSLEDKDRFARYNSKTKLYEIK